MNMTGGPLALALGIVGLVLAVINITMPFPVSLYLGWIALALVAIAALAGDKALTIATFVLSAVNLIFLSPVTLAFLIDDTGAGPGIVTLTIVCFAAPIVGLFLHASGKVVLGKQPDAQPQ